jgi:tetratricopeptide (TPR) repeat protein
MLRSRYYWAWHQQGVALEKMDRFFRAIYCYDRALEIYPEGDRTWYRQACCHAIVNSNRLALISLEQAIDLAPNKYRRLAKQSLIFANLYGELKWQQLMDNR